MVGWRTGMRVGGREGCASILCTSTSYAFALYAPAPSAAYALKLSARRA